MTIEDYVNYYQKKLAMCSLKDAIKNNNQISFLEIFYTVVLTWLEGVESNDDFKTKKSWLTRMSEYKNFEMLFSLVESIDELSKENDNKIDMAISLYNSLKNDTFFQQMSEIAGYSLPESFAVRENYLNGTLKSKVDFFRKFDAELNSIFYNLKEVESGGIGQNQSNGK